MKQDIYNILLLTFTLIASVGCSSSIPEADEPDPQPILMSNGMSLNFEPLAFARDGEGSVEAVPPETAGFFGEMEGYIYDIFFNQIVYYKQGDKYKEVKDAVKAEDWPTDNDWIYSPLKFWSNGRNYQFYCYAPHSSIENTTVKLTSNSYGAMTEFQISSIPPYSSYDYTMAAGYVFRKSGVVPFEMRHISARIRLRMKIGEEYSKLRRIKVTKVTVNDRTTGGTYNTAVMSLYDDESQNTLTTTPSGPYTPSGSDNEVFIIPIFESEDGLELDPDVYNEFGSLYVMPQDITSLTINVTYDVYDLDNSDPTRPSQHARNTVTFTNSNNGANYLTTESGKYYNIDIMVSPAYLYVLSDNDVKPDILITPETSVP